MIDLFFLAFLCSIGLIASYQDIRIGKVRNKLILIGLIGGIFAYSLLLIGGLFSPEFGFVYLKRVVINISISWVISFLIWYIGFWSAGDAKIFMLFSFLLPLKYYGNNPPIPFFPGFILLFNVFFFILLFIVIETLAKIIVGFLAFASKSRIHWASPINGIYYLKGMAKKIKVNRSKYIKTVLMFLCIFIFFYILRIYLKKGLTSHFPRMFDNLIYLLLLLAFRPMRKLMRRLFEKIKIMTICFLTGILFMVMFMLGVSNKSSLLELGKILVNFFGFAQIFLCFGLLEIYIIRKENMKISCKQISPNMVLSEDSIKKISPYLEKEGISEKFYPDGLTSKQIEHIHDLSSREDFNELSIYKTFPFVPFVFLGFIVTIVTRGSVLNSHIVSSLLRAMNVNLK